MSLILITGTAGSGKSALLRQFVLQSGTYIDFAMHLRNITPSEFVRHLANAFSLSISAHGIEEPANQELLVRRVGELPGRLRKRPLIVVDSLDEAREHSRIIAKLLGILGTRAEVIVAMRTGYERRLSSTLRPSILINLDDDKYFNPADIEGFVLRLMQAEKNSLPHNVRDSAVQSICKAAGRNFLIAGLLTLARIQAFYSGESWDDSHLPENVAGAMSMFIERLPDPERAWDLLLPPALGLGEGWPVNLWAKAVEELTKTACNDSEIIAFRKSAAEYLIERTIGPNENTVRLYHDALGMAVLSERADRARAWTRNPEEAYKADAQVVTRILIHYIGEHGWERATPYIWRFLPHHAAAAELLSELLEDLQFICYCDPQSVQVAVSKVPKLQSEPVVISHTSILHLCNNNASYNASLLRMAALYYGFDQVANELERMQLGKAPVVTWFGEARKVGLSSQSGHNDWVTNVTAFRNIAGSWRIATASSDKTIKLWDPLSDSVRPLITLTGHTDCVRDVKPLMLSKDSIGLVTGSDDGSVRIWRLSDRDGQEELSLTGHTDWVRAVQAYYWDGRLKIVSASDDGTVRIWDPSLDTPEVRTFAKHTGWVLAICVITTDKGPRVLSGGADGYIFVWDPENQSDQPLFDVKYHNDMLRAIVAYELPDGWQIISVGDDHIINIWNFDTPQKHQIIDSGTRSIRGVTAFRTLNGWALATGSTDQLVRIHEFDENDILHKTQVLKGHNDWVRGLYPMEGSTGEVVLLATGSDDGTLKLWEFSTRETKLVKTYENNRTWLRAVCDLGQGQIAAAGVDGQIHIWSIKGARKPLNSLPGHTNWVRALLVLPNGNNLEKRLLSASDDGTVRLWILNGIELKQSLILQSFSFPIRALSCFSNMGEEWVVAGGDDGIVYLWSINQSEKLPIKLKGNTDWVRSICAFHNEREWLVAAGGDDCVLRVWDPSDASGNPFIEFKGHTSSIRSLVAFPETGVIILASTSDDGTIRTWDLQEGGIKVVLGHKGSGLSLCNQYFAQKWTLVSASADEWLKIWDPNTLECLAEMPTLSPNFAVTSCGPNNLVVANQRGVLLVNLIDPTKSLEMEIP